MNPFFRQLLDSPIIILLIWITICVLALVLVTLRRRPLLLDTGENGSLHISRHALHKLIEATCEQTKGIASARARVSGQPGHLSTHIRLKVHPGARLDVLQHYLAQEVLSIYRNNLGIANEGATHIEVTGVIPDDKPL